MSVASQMAELLEQLLICCPRRWTIVSHAAAVEPRPGQSSYRLARARCIDGTDADAAKAIEEVLK
jgi:hypothetical protein